VENSQQDIFRIAGDNEGVYCVGRSSVLTKKSVVSVESYTLFRLLRAALREQTRGVFAVLVDTTSHVSNFAPSVQGDPSTRDRPADDMKIGQKLFRPFHWVTTTDVLKGNGKKAEFVLGRPLWKTTLDYRRGDLVSLMRFAWDKLSCQKSLESRDVIIAMLAVSTGLTVSPMSTTAIELVGSHMATCGAIDDSREALYISYPAEPIMTEAALDQLKKALESNESAPKIFDSLLYYMRIGTLDAGRNGELVIKLLLLLARAKSSERLEVCRSTGFLKNLCGSNTNLTGKISFTCFSKVTRWGQISFKNLWNRQIPKILLKALYERRVAMEFPDNQVGADFLVPICVNEDDYRYILVQAKNVVDWSDSKASEAREKLRPEKVFPNNTKWVGCDSKLRLLINVGKEQEPNVKVNTEGDVTFVEINGLDGFSCLFAEGTSSDVKKGLRSILREPSPEDWLDRKEEEEQFLSFDPIFKTALDYKTDKKDKS